jgi:3-phosphoshikimate 1-carboxyvinyltransferase
MAEGLAHLGVPVDVTENEMQIRGGVAHGGEVSSAGDHRIAMAFGVVGAAVGDVVIDGAECVSKTYPAFWQAFSDLGVEVMLSE